MAGKVSRRIRRIGVATTDWSSSIPSPAGGMAMGGAGWVRFGQLARYSNHHVVLGRLIYGSGKLGVVGWDGQTYTDCDVLFIQRYMDDWVPDAIATVRQRGQHVVNDIDDWFWGLHPENAAAAAVDPEKNTRANIDHYRAAIEASTMVTVSTPWLQRTIAEWGVPVRLVQNRVTCVDFKPRKHVTDQPILGWTGSTAHRSGDLAVLADLAGVLDTNWRWHHTGQHDHHPSFAERIGVHPKRVSTLPMLAPWEYPNGYLFDIGTVPLVDVPFNHAKSFIKGIEYAAAGVPFVASALPEYLRLRDEYGIGRTAHTLEQWVRHVEELTDRSVRAEEAARQRELVLDQLDVRFQAADIDAIVAELCG